MVTLKLKAVVMAEKLAKAQLKEFTATIVSLESQNKHARLNNTSGSQGKQSVTRTTPVYPPHKKLI